MEESINCQDVKFNSGIFWQSVKDKMWDSDLDANARLVLTALADNAHDKNWVFPSLATLMFKAKRCKNTVLKSLRTLQEKGFILIEKMRKFNGLGNKYNILTDIKFTGSEANRPTPQITKNNNLKHGGTAPKIDADDTNNNQLLIDIQQKSDQFSEFWNSYPAQKDIMSARSAYKKALEEISHEEIMLALNAYKKQLTEKNIIDSQYIKYPSNFLKNIDKEAIKKQMEALKEALERLKAKTEMDEAIAKTRSKDAMMSRMIRACAVSRITVARYYELFGAYDGTDDWENSFEAFILAEKTREKEAYDSPFPPAPEPTKNPKEVLRLFGMGY